DRHAAVPGREDDVEEIGSLEHLAEPALVLDLDGIAELLEMGEDARSIARLAEDVEILGGTRDAGVGPYRIGAGHEERHAEVRKLCKNFRIKRLRLGGRSCRSGNGLNHGQV